MREIRRKDREIPLDETLSVLNSAEYGVLSTASMDHQPYGIPISFCFMDGCLYFHCAIEGRKIENIESNQSVSFCAVGKTEILSDKFSTKYESAVVAGHAEEVFDTEKQQALEGLVQKYSPDYIEQGGQYINALTHKTRVFKITPSHITGKSRRK